MPRNPKKPAAKAKKPSVKPPKRKSVRSKTSIKNSNSVRVHIINAPEGGNPTPYTGPDRSNFAFNPVFDIGREKEPSLPPMNTGVPLAATPVKPAVFASPDSMDASLLDRFLTSTNASMSTGRGAPESPGVAQADQNWDALTMKDLKDMARNMNITLKKPNKATLIAALKQAIARGKTPI